MKSKISLILILLVLVGALVGFLLLQNSGGNRITVLCPSEAAELFQKIADCYEGEGLPKVQIKNVDEAQYAAALEGIFSGTNVPDLVVFPQEALYPSESVLAHLRDLSALPGVEKSYLSLREGEQLPLLPICGDIPVIYFNIDFFLAEQRQVPHSVYDFLNMCNQFREKGISPLGLRRDQSANLSAVAALLDCSLVSNGAAMFEDISFTLFASLADNGVFDQALASDREQLIAGFRDGQYPMFLGYWSDASALKSMELPFDYDVFRLPGFMETRCPLIPTYSLAVLADAKEQTEPFVSFCLTEAVQELISAERGAMPIAPATGYAIEEDTLFGGIFRLGLESSALFSKPVEKRAQILEEFAKLVAGEAPDYDRLRSLLISSDSLKGDNNETVPKDD